MEMALRIAIVESVPLTIASLSLEIIVALDFFCGTPALSGRDTEVLVEGFVLFEDVCVTVSVGLSFEKRWNFVSVVQGRWRSSVLCRKVVQQFSEAGNQLRLGRELFNRNSGRLYK